MVNWYLTGAGTRPTILLYGGDDALAARRFHGKWP